MDDSKGVAFMLLIVAGFGLYLHAQNKLVPAVQIITGPNDTGNQTVQLGPFVVAFIVYLFALSFMSAHDGTLLTIVVVMGALLVNNRNMGDKDLLHTLFA